MAKRKKPTKDANGGKLGQFTSEGHSEKIKWFWKGFTAVNWIIAVGSFIVGMALGLSI